MLCLQANMLTSLVSWMLAEDGRFLGQKKKTSLLTAKAVAKGTAFAKLVIQVPFP